MSYLKKKNLDKSKFQSQDHFKPLNLWIILVVQTGTWSCKYLKIISTILNWAHFDEE